MQILTSCGAICVVGLFILPAITSCSSGGNQKYTFGDISGHGEKQVRDIPLGTNLKNWNIFIHEVSNVPEWTSDQKYVGVAAEHTFYDAASKTVHQDDIDNLLSKLDAVRTSLDTSWNYLFGSVYSSFDQALSYLGDAVADIFDKTTNSDIKNLCNLLHEEINKYTQYKTLVEFDNLIQQMRGAVGSLPIYQEDGDPSYFQSAYMNLQNSLLPFNNLFEHLQSLLSYSHSSEGGWLVVETFVNNVAPANPGAGGYTGSVGYVFLFDYSFQYGSGDSAKTIEYTGLLTQLFDGGGTIYSSGAQIIIEPYVGFNTINSCIHAPIEFVYSQNFNGPNIGVKDAITNTICNVYNSNTWNNTPNDLSGFWQISIQDNWYKIKILCDLFTIDNQLLNFSYNNNDYTNGVYNLYVQKD